MRNLSDSEKSYRTIPGGAQTNQREREENCFKFLKYFFCFYNLCLVVGYVDIHYILPMLDVLDVCDLRLQ